MFDAKMEEECAGRTFESGDLVSNNKTGGRKMVSSI
jgi:hypothetical protein